MSISPSREPAGPSLPSFHVFTTGCKANQWDSLVITEGLKRAGLVQTSFARADLLIVNGCTLTEHAERDIRRFVQRCRNLRPGVKVILAGCHSQVYPDNSFGADLVLGQQEKFEMARFIGQAGTHITQGRALMIEQWSPNGTMGGRTRFFFKIQDGCNRFCAYCVVPFARGRNRSRPLAEVLEGMAYLRGKGVKEVVLTGIDLASYKDAPSGLDFTRLIELLEGAETPPRIRISSVEPMSLDQGLIDRISASRKIAPSLHIPLQSGCDRILKEMGRPYTTGHMRDLIGTLHERIPEVGIGMDVLVGFPGENEGDFEETCAYIESLDIYYLHVFPYSDRKGTRASIMEPKVAEPVKKARVRRLKEIDRRKRAAFYERFVGQRVTVIPEGKQFRNGLMKGYSGNYIPVYLPYQKTLENNLIDVKIKGLQNNLPLGEAECS